MLDQLQHTGKRTSVKIILWAGLLVGTLDILSAFVDYYIATGKNPLAVLTFVASGVFGESAFAGGAGTMLLGLLFHYVIAFSFTILFFWLFLNTKLLPRNTIITGVIYGLFIWAVMNLVVVQLCNAPHASIKDMKMAKVIKAMLILIFMIGLPLSFIAQKYFSGNGKEKVNGFPD